MAAGLHKIAHKGYCPDGSGRDWFFIGDFEYRNGCKTPNANTTGVRPTRPPAKPRGAPAEVTFQKRANAGAGKAKTTARWMKVHEENMAGGSPQTQLARSASATSSPYKTHGSNPFVATSWQLGAIPGWTGKRFDLPNGTELEDAGVIRCASAPAFDPGPGDHTRGIKGPSPHFMGESWKFGSIPGWKAKRFELARGAELEDAGVIRALPRNEKKRQEGDHCLGIHGPTPHFKSTYQGLGEGFRQTEYGSPAKHQTHATAVFPDVEHKIIAEAGAAARDGEYKPGDHTRGIRSTKPHFTTTYDSHGQIPGFEKKRYDFGPVATRDLRLTEWGRGGT